MPIDAPKDPLSQQHGPQPEVEDLVDLNLDEPLEGDLQAVADEVASEYHTQVVPELDVVDLPQPTQGPDARVDLESALSETERQISLGCQTRRKSTRQVIETSAAMTSTSSGPM